MAMTVIKLLASRSDHDQQLPPTVATVSDGVMGRGTMGRGAL